MGIVYRLQRMFSDPPLNPRDRGNIRAVNNAAKPEWDDEIPRDVSWLVHDLRQGGASSIDVRVDYFPLSGSPLPPYEILLQSEYGRTSLYRGKTNPARNPVDVTRNLLLDRAVKIAEYLRELGFQPTVMGTDPHAMKDAVAKSLREGPVWHT